VIAMVPSVLVVHPAVRASTVQELIALTKTQPGKYNYASTGNGSTLHLTAELLKTLTGVQIVHIPYNGIPAALTDLMVGQIHMMFVNVSNALPHITSGKLKVLAVTSDGRFPALPEVPALSETLPGFVSVTWYGLVAPRKRRRRLPPGSRPLSPRRSGCPMSRRSCRIFRPRRRKFARGHARFFKQEVARWHKVILSAGIKPD